MSYQHGYGQDSYGQPTFGQQGYAPHNEPFGQGYGSVSPSRGMQPADVGRILAMLVAALSVLTLGLGLFQYGYFVFWGVVIAVLALITVISDKVDTRTIAAVVAASAVGNAVAKAYDIIYSAIQSSDEYYVSRNSAWDYVYLALVIVLAVVAVLWLVAELGRTSPSEVTQPVHPLVNPVQAPAVMQQVAPAVEPWSEAAPSRYGQAHGAAHGVGHQSAAEPMYTPGYTTTPSHDAQAAMPVYGSASPSAAQPSAPSPAFGYGAVESDSVSTHGATATPKPAADGPSGLGGATPSS